MRQSLRKKGGFVMLSLKTQTLLTAYILTLFVVGTTEVGYRYDCDHSPNNDCVQEFGGGNFTPDDLFTVYLMENLTEGILGNYTTLKNTREDNNNVVIQGFIRPLLGVMVYSSWPFAVLGEVGGGVIYEALTPDLTLFLIGFIPLIGLSLTILLIMRVVNSLFGGKLVEIIVWIVFRIKKRICKNEAG